MECRKGRGGGLDTRMATPMTTAQQPVTHTGSADLTPDHRPASSPHKNPPYSSKTLRYGALPPPFQCSSADRMGMKLFNSIIAKMSNGVSVSSADRMGMKFAPSPVSTSDVLVSVSSADRMGMKSRVNIQQRGDELFQRLLNIELANVRRKSST